MTAEESRSYGERTTVRVLIQLAEEGHLYAAWTLINQIENVLHDDAKHSEAAGNAQPFFARILDAHDSEDDTRRDLEKALNTLGVVRPRGRPKRDRFDVAWRRVKEIQQYLAGQASASELHAYAARFFEALLDLRNNGAESPKHLVGAFETLNLIRPRKRPKRDSFDITELIARVIMLERMGCPADAATGLLDELQIDRRSYSKSAYARAYYDDDDETERLKRLLIDEELEALAGVSFKDLLCALANANRKLPNK